MNDIDFFKMKKKEKIFNIFRLVTLFLFLPFFILSCFSIYGTILLILNFLLFTISMALLFGNRSTFKEKIIPKYIDDDLKFTCQSDAMNALVIKSEIISGNIKERITTNDIISGDYNSIRFRSFDCIVFKRNLPFQRYYKNETKRIFKGRFYQIRNITNIRNKIIIYNINNPSNKEINIKSNNEEFNKEFGIYTKNESEIFNNENFLNDIINLNNKFEGTMSFSFINSSIFVAINNEIDSFELEEIEQIEEISAAYQRDLRVVQDVFLLATKYFDAKD